MSKSKSTWEMIKLGLILACYAMASCTVLALVNWGTSAKIQQNKIEKASQGMKAIIPEATEFIKVEDFAKSEDATISITEFYLAKLENETLGAIVQVSGPSYDKATIMLGLKPDGTILGLKFMELTDSPGFGQKANDPTFFVKSGKTFYGQFEGLNAKEGFILNKNVDVISGATITSQGIINLISEGAKSVLKYFGNLE